MELRTPSAADHAALRALLRANQLPVEDLDASPVDFLVAVEGERLVGAVGLERRGGAGLLRSLVVEDDARGTGLGIWLVSALEAKAQADGVERLVLLTQSAQRFFAARGYEVIDRGTVPPGILDSAEFKSLCPASATCMGKTLERR